ncbi:MAG: glutamyl-tRNA reductase [Candidatus Omnitrophica bacterium]|nr:glutamyl-tRNA reductase [Candidatus Omnitrophota bacterium]
MNFTLVGLNFKTAPIEIRELFYLQPLERSLLLAELKTNPKVIEAFVLSTCNRTEIYARMIDDDPSPLLDLVFKIKKAHMTRVLMNHFYVLKNDDVIKHFLEVTCGLDSLVIGEKQILGQVKESTKLAHEMGMLSQVFNILINTAVHAGKLVQQKTQIGAGGSSVSWAAVNMAQKILGPLNTKDILIIGAGKMSYLTADQLNRKPVNNIFIMNRTKSKADELAKKIGGIAVLPWDLKSVLSKVDACICSAGASYFLIESEIMEEVMRLRDYRPLLLIDISTPRNIDPLVSQINNVNLVSMDDLHKAIDTNLMIRQAAVQSVQEIINYKIKLFNHKIIKGGYMNLPAFTH